MDGILLVIKPPGMTSFDVIAHLRKILKIKKIGHAGTLDPAAGGLLPVCIGKATKAVDRFLKFDKSYRAEMILGVVTDTQDAEGRVLEKNTVTADENVIVEAVKSFVGRYEQIPPMYSAIKVNGKKLYEFARQGVEIGREPRQVEIFRIDVVDIKQRGDTVAVKFDVDCSKGTYIRTLCHDIGQRLGCGAHMSFLVRTRVGPFSLTDGITLEEISKSAEEGTLQSVVKPVDILFNDLNDIVLDDRSLSRFLNGAAVLLQNNALPEKKPNVRVYSDRGTFIGLGVVSYSGEKKVLHARKIFVSDTRPFT